jgi:hypothetical protein
MALLPDYKGATLPAQEKIMELRVAALELQEENIRLKKRVKELEEELKLKGQLRFDEKVYWLDKGDGTEDGPYCQLCYDGEHKRIRLQSIETATGPRWSCLKCKALYRR